MRVADSRKSLGSAVFEGSFLKVIYDEKTLKGGKNDDKTVKDDKYFQVLWV